MGDGRGAARLDIFRREGDYWTIGSDEAPVRLRDSKGLRYLDVLISNPGVEHHALDLVGGGARGRPSSGSIDEREGFEADPFADAGPALDSEAKSAYRRRLAELGEELAEAEAFNDPERAARARAEADLITEELAKAVGLGGRDRRLASAAERARVNVTRSIRTAMAKIAANDDALGRYLEATVKTGTFCCYRPIAVPDLEAPAEPEASAPVRIPLPPLVDADPAFVGRADELEALTASWRAAARDGCRMVLVGGEPGIGKTRLASRFAKEVDGEGATVLAGRADREAVLPYQPLVEALAAYVAVCPPGPLRAQVGDRGGELARVVPHLADRIPDLPSPVTGDPEGDRYRFFEAVTHFVGEMTRAAPVLAVLDDLHWADPGTLALLRHLARALRDRPLVLLGTYRASEVDPSHPLAHAIADLRREQPVELLSLDGLDDDQVADLIGLTLGRGTPAELSRRIHDATAGNPFFVKQVVGGLDSESATGDLPAVPQTVKDAIADRLAPLGETAHRVLTAAAVAGREFDLDVLEAVLGLSADQVLAAVEAAAAAGLVTEHPEVVGRYGFVHALVQEALYEASGRTRRLRTHRAIAKALEAAREPALGTIARHYLAAAESGSANEAFDSAMKAGRAAVDLVAYEDAIGHFDSALEAFGMLEAASEEQRLEALLARARAERLAARSDEARATLREVAAAAIAADLPDQLAQAALELEAMSWQPSAASVDRELVQLLRQALDRIPAERKALRAGLLAALTVSQTYSGADAAQLVEQAQEAIDLARASNDPGTIAYALQAAHPAAMVLVDARARLRTSDEMIAAARAADDRERGVWAHVYRVVDLLELGDMEAVDAEIEAVTQMVESLRTPMYRWFPAMWRATRALIEGRTSDGERLATEAYAIGEPAWGGGAATQLSLQLFTLKLIQGRVDEIVDAMSAMAERNPDVSGYRCALAQAYALLDRTEEARKVYGPLAADDFAAVPRDWNWIVSTALLAEACRKLEDERGARTLYAALRPRADACVVSGWAAGFAGVTHRFLGLLADTAGEWDAAERHFEEALRRHEAMGARPLVVWTEVEYATMLLRRGSAADRRRAEVLSDAAIAEAAELGMGAVRRPVAAAARVEAGPQG